MIRKFLDRLTGRTTVTSQRDRLLFDTTPDAIYAVGDVHGCLSLLLKMEAAIIEDAAQINGEKYIVMLGDYVDRGPKSAAVIEHLTGTAPAGFRRICLAGNHEEVMLSYINAPSASHPWLGLGGMDTLHSYGITDSALRRQAAKPLIDSHIPDEHVEFLRSAPSLVAFPGICLVHAGIRNGVPLRQQQDSDLLWKRPDRNEDGTCRNFIVVHGHTPVPEVEITPWRINVDTGGFINGVLSCVRYTRESMITVISVNQT